jgi:Prokaryotic membrane lipoprotein lipid attachment site
MRQLFIATVALLVLSGCKTSGYNPLKIESQENWRPAAGIERLLKLFIDRAD